MNITRSKFPIEIHLAILQQLRDSRDVINFIEAFPELKNTTCLVTDQELSQNEGLKETSFFEVNGIDLFPISLVSDASSYECLFLEVNYSESLKNKEFLKVLSQFRGTVFMWVSLGKNLSLAKFMEALEKDSKANSLNLIISGGDSLSVNLNRNLKTNFKFQNIGSLWLEKKGPSNSCKNHHQSIQIENIKKLGHISEHIDQLERIDLLQVSDDLLVTSGSRIDQETIKDTDHQERFYFIGNQHFSQSLVSLKIDRVFQFKDMEFPNLKHLNLAFLPKCKRLDSFPTRYAFTNEMMSFEQITAPSLTSLTIESYSRNLIVRNLNFGMVSSFSLIYQNLTIFSDPMVAITESEVPENFDHNDLLLKCDISQFVTNLTSLRLYGIPPENHLLKHLYELKLLEDLSSLKVRLTSPKVLSDQDLNLPSLKDLEIYIAPMADYDHWMSNPTISNNLITKFNAPQLTSLWVEFECLFDDPPSCKPIWQFTNRSFENLKVIDFKDVDLLYPDDPQIPVPNLRELSWLRCFDVDRKFGFRKPTTSVCFKRPISIVSLQIELIEGAIADPLDEPEYTLILHGSLWRKFCENDDNEVSVDQYGIIFVR